MHTSRGLSTDEKAGLHRDMVESSAWACAELKRRYEEKAKKALNMVLRQSLAPSSRS